MLVTLPWEILDKTKLQTWKFQGQKQRPLEIPNNSFLITPKNPSSFFGHWNFLSNFHMRFFNNTPPQTWWALFGFFLK